MKTIPLTKGIVAIVDDEDYEELSRYKWYAHGGYAARTPWPVQVPKTVFMHRLLTCCSTDKQVDHINGNRADNRKSNLRVCTEAENHFNQKVRSNNTSGIKGVSWRPTRGAWRARIRALGKEISLGHFKTKEEAAVAYETAAVLYFGEFKRKETA